MGSLLSGGQKQTFGTPPAMSPEEKRLIAAQAGIGEAQLDAILNRAAPRVNQDLALTDPLGALTQALILQELGITGAIGQTSTPAVQQAAGQATLGLAAPPSAKPAASAQTQVPGLDAFNLMLERSKLLEQYPQGVLPAQLEDRDGSVLSLAQLVGRYGEGSRGVFSEQLGNAQIAKTPHPRIAEIESLLKGSLPQAQAPSGGPAQPGTPFLTAESPSLGLTAPPQTIGQGASTVALPGATTPAEPNPAAGGTDNLGELTRLIREQGSINAAGIANENFARAQKLFDLELANIESGPVLTPQQGALIDQQANEAISATGSDIDKFVADAVASIQNEYAPSRGLRPTDTPVVNLLDKTVAEAARQRGQTAFQIRSQAANQKLTYPLSASQLRSGQLQSQQNLAAAGQQFQEQLAQNAQANRLALAGMLGTLRTQATSNSLGLAGIQPNLGGVAALSSSRNALTPTSTSTSPGLLGLATGVGSLALGAGSLFPGIGASLFGAAGTPSASALALRALPWG